MVVGLGGSGTNDGGAGLLAALGATADRPLDEGAAGLAGHHLGRAARAVDVELVAASDVDNPLTGLFGATKVFGPQKGVAEDRLPVLDGWLEELAVATDRRTALEKGAGAAGGLGFALLLLGATREPGHRPGRGRAAARRAGRARRPGDHRRGLVRLLQPRRQGAVRRRRDRRGRAAPLRGAGRAGSMSGSREMRALGVESAYSLVDLVGEERAFADPAAALGDLAERIARTWSR